MIVRKIGIFQVLGAVLAVATGAFLWSFILGENGLWSQHKLKNQIARLEQEKESLQAELVARHHEGERLLKDSFYIESIARTKFGMAKKNEIVYQFIDD